MPSITFSAALAAQALADQRRGAVQIPLQLELPRYEDARLLDPEPHGRDHELTALVLEEDGSFSELFDDL
ncbi:MAG TPA: hypothetical protein VHB23_08790 [Devosiaceae bacterium]|nr:hypothetical protein [Devosiaceae bacterium]